MLQCSHSVEKTLNSTPTIPLLRRHTLGLHLGAMCTPHHDNRSVYCIPPYTPLLYIPDKIRNATRRTDQLSGRSQVMGELRLYRCKGISGTASLHIVCNQASKMWTRKLAKNQVGVKL